MSLDYWARAVPEEHGPTFAPVLDPATGELVEVAEAGVDFEPSRFPPWRDPTLLDRTLTAVRTADGPEVALEFRSPPQGPRLSIVPYAAPHGPHRPEAPRELPRPTGDPLASLYLLTADELRARLKAAGLPPTLRDRGDGRPIFCKDRAVTALRRYMKQSGSHNP